MVLVVEFNYYLIGRIITRFWPYQYTWLSKHGTIKKNNALYGFRKDKSCSIDINLELKQLSRWLLPRNWTKVMKSNDWLNTRFLLLYGWGILAEWISTEKTPIYNKSYNNSAVIPSNINHPPIDYLFYQYPLTRKSPDGIWTNPPADNDLRPPCNNCANNNR